LVRRSAALLNYGDKFEFSEVQAQKSAFAAYATMLALFAFALLLSLAPTRWLLVRFVLPAPGQGPSQESMRNGFFKSKLIAEVAGDASKRVVCKIDGKRDPGYGATARMISMTALCLLRREGKIGARGAAGAGGVLTPASACGMALLPHLAEVDINFKVDRE